MPTFDQVLKQKIAAQKRLTTILQAEAALIAQASTALAKIGYTIERVNPVTIATVNGKPVARTVVVDEIEKAWSTSNGHATDAKSQKLLGAVLKDMANPKWNGKIAIGPTLVPAKLMPTIAPRLKALSRKRQRAVNRFLTGDGLASYKPRRRKKLLFVCPRKGCDRRFRHPLPMARHLVATHGAKKKSAR